MAIKQSTRVLRQTSITTAVISLLLNTISLIVNKRTVNWRSPTDVLAWSYFPIILCIAGNHAILNSQYLFKKDIHPNLLIILDDCAFLGFLALLVANGVIISNLSGSGHSTSSTDKIQMLTYNSIPWVVCAHSITEQSRKEGTTEKDIFELFAESISTTHTDIGIVHYPTQAN